MTTVAMLAVERISRRKGVFHLRPHGRRGVRGFYGRLLAYPVLLGVIVASVSGCAVGPNFNPAAAPEVNGYVPGKLASPDPGRGGPRVAGQHFVSGADVSARWGAAFKSPLLHELVKQSVGHNANLQATHAASKHAQYNAPPQRGLFFPQVTGTSTASSILVANPGRVP